MKRSYGMGTWTATAASVAVLVVGCGEGAEPDGADGWAGSVDTVASGRVVVTNPDRAYWPGGSPVTLVERFRIGALDSGGPDMFGAVTDVELGADGTLYVLDGQASEVRVFSADGEFLRTLGRAGEGPGELNRPGGLALDSQGTVWVMNWGNARYSGFDPASGELRREVRRLASFAAFPWPGAFDGQDRLLDVGLDAAGEVAILRTDTAFVPTDTLLSPRPDPSHLVTFRSGGLPRMSIPDPFAPRPSWSAAFPAGIVVGEGAEYRLQWIGFDGDTTRTAVLLRDPEPVTAAEGDSALAAFQSVAEQVGSATPDRQPRVADRKPAHGALFVDDQGRVWVRSMLDGEQVWDVFGADGAYRGPVKVPPAGLGSATVVRNGRMAAVARPDGVPTVVVYDLVTGSSQGGMEP